jgi:predicted GNAT family acetyltransferase
MTPPTVVVVHRPEAARFEASVDGRMCVADYRLYRGVMSIVHTAVPKSLAGRGIAAALIRAVLDHARGAGLKVRPDCSYAELWMQRHPDYDDLRVDREA